MEHISERQEKVLNYLKEHNIPFSCYNHPEGKTIEEAKRWWEGRWQRALQEPLLPQPQGQPPLSRMLQLRP